MFERKLTKKDRMKKIINPITGKCLLVAFDQAVEHGPREYINIDLNPIRIAKIAVNGGANGIILNIGSARLVKDYLPKNFALIIKLTARTSMVSDKSHMQAVTTTVDEAYSLGADGVAYTIYPGSDMEYKMFENLAWVKKRCAELDIPITGFMYPRSPKYKNKYDYRALEYAARIGAELGFDIVKTYYSGNPETFRNVVKNCFVPLLVAGGPPTKTKEEFLQHIEGALNAGAKGFALGRNIWMRDEGVELLREVKKLLDNKI